MFQKIQRRLLLSYLVVLISILLSFAIAVRIVFTRVLSERSVENLKELAKDAASDMYFDDNQLKVHEEISLEQLNPNHQALQWFDLEGNLVEARGLPENLLDPPFPRQINWNKVMTDKKHRQWYILPVKNYDFTQTLGYVIASQSQDYVNSTLKKLDIGLGGSITIALIFSGISGIFLTRQAMQPIEESFRRLQQFTADASHELRGPLMAVKSNVDVALKYPEGMRSSDAEKLKAVTSAVKQMTHLTEDLLFLARTEQTPREERKPVDLEELLDGLVQLYTPQAKERRINLKVYLTNHLDLLGEPIQLNRLFSNLIENALKYTVEGGKVEIRTSREGYYLRVHVRDTGIGIAPEHIKYIFDRFWRADEARAYRTGGSGLGLAIAQVIARNHGGSISVTSQVGVGSCFTVRLPACGR
ncbi:sensor histidine kinase [Microcoleus sp. FACHB-SPT15]|uniref:sensor histidine kinase n=1 Tax=Microcoleus sp. FACHB-SPT15 TaxID=2692830 RepID=UPI00177FE67C|nr:HAMP domain-containing sensor histidine kinase [Microcoleus sp. FACHB-SPT15]MBD1804127.1 sensor histidine kinase [Microcoleus sp. FACHB-SPT15]